MCITNHHPNSNLQLAHSCHQSKTLQLLGNLLYFTHRSSNQFLTTMMIMFNSPLINDIVTKLPIVLQD
jgi:hypothetical protein